MNAIQVEQLGRGWKWATAFVGCMAMLVSLSPAMQQASADVAFHTGRLEKMIVRAVPGHVAEAERLVTASGGVVGRKLSIISGFAAKLPVDAANDLRAMGEVVAAVDLDTPMRPLSVDPALGYDTTGDFGSMSVVTQLVGAQALWTQGYTGQGVDVALVDTGVAPVTGLSDKIVNGPDLSLDYQYGLAESVDAYGHGTHMAGLIAGRDPGATASRTGCTACLNNSGYSDPSKFVGVAPDARIVNVKVGAADGSTDVSQVIAGIDWVVQHRSDNGLNIKVLNLSFGTLSGQPYTVDPLAYAAEVAWRRGVVVVAAAGNDGPTVDRLPNPAYNPRLLAVGAYDPNNSKDPKKWTPADFTNAGSSNRVADVFAPGAHLLGLRVPGSFVDSNYPASQVGTRFTRGSGSSQAAAVTSGLVADLFQKYPNATPDQMKMILVESRNDFGLSLPLSLLGLDKDDTGTLNGMKALTKSLSSNSNGHQDFAYATGTGSLETARGGLHLSNGTTELTGEYDIFGNAWDAEAWATASAAGTSWDGGLWNASRWTGDGWTGQRWSNSTWAGNDWTGQRWSGQRWSGLVWDGQRWSGQRWSDAGWAGQRWSGEGWDGQRWSGQRWSGQLWSSTDWQ